MKKMLVPITWLQGISHGYANGYVGVDKSHPLYGKNYDEVDIAVHGGLTFSAEIKTNNKIFPADWIGLWVFGFDTAHYSDTQATCDEEYCNRELDKLFNQLAEQCPVSHS